MLHLCSSTELSHAILGLLGSFTLLVEGKHIMPLAKKRHLNKWKKDQTVLQTSLPFICSLHSSRRGCKAERTTERINTTLKHANNCLNLIPVHQLLVYPLTGYFRQFISTSLSVCLKWNDAWYTRVISSSQNLLKRSEWSKECVWSIWPVDRCREKFAVFLGFTGLTVWRFPLLSACRFVEFDTSLICNV